MAMNQPSWRLAMIVPSCYNVSIRCGQQNGCTALHAAAAAGQIAVVQHLLDKESVDINATDDENQTPLHYAAFYGHLEVAQLLVDRGASHETKDKYGRPAHFAASINGHLDVVKYLMEECKGVDIDAKDEHGATCLHWAALKGRREVVQYLCEQGINIHITSVDNKTAQQLAKDKQKTKCRDYLQNLHDRSKKFLIAAKAGNNAEICRIIEEVGKTFPLRYLRDERGRNAMHIAAEHGHLPTLKILCEHFDDWSAVDKFGRNVLHCAALSGKKEIVSWLLRKQKTFLESRTSTMKTASRCAFDAGFSGLASTLQNWEDNYEDFKAEEGEDDDDRAPSSPSGARDMNTVHSWLKSFNMDEYTQKFARDGFDTLRGVSMIQESDLIEMSVKKGHRRVVLSHVEELRHQLSGADDSTTSNTREQDAGQLDSFVPLKKTPSMTGSESTPAPTSSVSVVGAPPQESSETPAESPAEASATAVDDTAAPHACQEDDASSAQDS